MLKDWPDRLSRTKKAKEINEIKENERSDI